jgi:hypothetical protein
MAPIRVRFSPTFFSQEEDFPQSNLLLRTSRTLENFVEVAQAERHFPQRNSSLARRIHTYRGCVKYVVSVYT